MIGHTYRKLFPIYAVDEPIQEYLTYNQLQIDEIVITGAKLNASAGLIPGLSADVILPEIRLQSLGTGPEGISPAELTAMILNRITEEAAKKGAGGALKDLLNGGDVKINTDLKKGIEGLGKLLK